MNNIVWLLEFIKQLSKTGYTGSIEVNFNKGGVTTVNTREVIRPPAVVRVELETITK